MISPTRLPTITNVDESWNQIKDTIYEAAYATLGVTTKRLINRDTWLLNDDIVMKVHEKERPQVLPTFGPVPPASATHSSTRVR